ncbi:hypothetical protein M0R45_027516 [Rubus argutus]|uniref:F-box domain-containing protein n=1 Tax=Rubus argutus TaxID=59490 RepID=A0AAW1X393_RUBAR
MTEFGKDLVEKILSILPPKTLMRFKCTSKEWYALINNPRFVAKHLFNFNSNSNSKHNNNLSTNCVLLMKKLLVSKDTNNITNETKEEEELVFSLLNFCNDNDDEHNTVLSSVEDIKIPLSMILKTSGESLGIIGHCNGIICLLLVDSFQVILWNPAIQEFKLLPPLPFLPDDLWCKHAQGFGFDPKLNQYKVVGIGLVSPFSNDDGYNYYHPPKAAIFTMSSSDSWREINTNSLETETTVLRPEEFQIQFKQMCYWFGHEQHKELSWGDALEEERIRQVIILFDIGDEVFQDIMLPESLCQPCVSINGNLLVWNESLALLGWAGWMPVDIVDASFGIWVMDDHELGGPTGPWTKHITFEPTEKPLAFLNGDEILMYDFNECIFSYNLGTKRRKDLQIQTGPSNDIIITVVYVKSIVSIFGDNKLESRDNSTIKNFSLLEYFPSNSLTVNKKWNSYSLWAIPPDDVSQRIKKVMRGLRAEFGGPEIEPHIPVVGSIRMSHEDLLDKLRSLRSCNQCNVCTYQAKVESVVIRNFYHQCVSLLIDSSMEVSKHLRYITGIFCGHFGFYKDVRPHLSLLYGNLTEEERKIALERVSILDESISSLSFTITQFAVYKIDYKDTTLKSWKKIAAYTLPSHLMLENENA